MTEQAKATSKIGDVEFDAAEADLPDRAFRNAWVVDGDVVEIDAVKRREILTNRVITERDRRMEIVVGQYSETEQKTWPMQIEEARAVLVDPDDPALMIRPLAEARGQPIADFAAYIIQLNNAYRAATGAVFAASRRLIDADPIPADFANDRYWP